MDCSPWGSSVPGDSPGKNTGLGCHALLQGIFPTQGSNLLLLCLLHWQVGSLPLAPPEKPYLSSPYTWAWTWVHALVEFVKQAGLRFSRLRPGPQMCIFNQIPLPTEFFISGQRQPGFEETLVLLQPKMDPITLLIELSQKELGE